jgi:hypothetical protein
VSFLPAVTQTGVVLEAVAPSTNGRSRRTLTSYSPGSRAVAADAAHMTAAIAIRDGMIVLGRLFILASRPFNKSGLVSSGLSARQPVSRPQSRASCARDISRQ